MKVPELAKVFNWSTETQHRVERGTKPLDRDQLALLAEATGVPYEFLEHGFGYRASNNATALMDRVDALEAAVRILIEGTVSAGVLRGRDAPGMPGQRRREDLGRDLRP